MVAAGTTGGGGGQGGATAAVGVVGGAGVVGVGVPAVLEGGVEDVDGGAGFFT